MIRIVHRSQELEGTEEGIFVARWQESGFESTAEVTVIPSGAVEHVVGPGGEHIRGLVESVGAEVNISCSEASERPFSSCFRSSDGFLV